jgi:hypothetical protein
LFEKGTFATLQAQYFNTVTLLSHYNIAAKRLRRQRNSQFEPEHMGIEVTCESIQRYSGLRENIRSRNMSIRDTSIKQLEYIGNSTTRGVVSKLFGALSLSLKDAAAVATL